MSSKSKSRSKNSTSTRNENDRAHQPKVVNGTMNVEDSQNTNGHTRIPDQTPSILLLSTASNNGNDTISSPSLKKKMGRPSKRKPLIIDQSISNHHDNVITTPKSAKKAKNEVVESPLRRSARDRDHIQDQLQLAIALSITDPPSIPSPDPPAISSSSSLPSYTLPHSLIPSYRQSEYRLYSSYHISYFDDIIPVNIMNKLQRREYGIGYAREKIVERREVRMDSVYARITRDHPFPSLNELLQLPWDSSSVTFASSPSRRYSSTSPTIFIPSLNVARPNGKRPAHSHIEIRNGVSVYIKDTMDYIHYMRAMGRQKEIEHIDLDELRKRERRDMKKMGKGGGKDMANEMNVTHKVASTFLVSQTLSFTFSLSSFPYNTSFSSPCVSPPTSPYHPTPSHTATLTPKQNQTRICILILAHAGINQGKMWERWYKEAKQEVKERVHVYAWMPARYRSEFFNDERMLTSQVETRWGDPSVAYAYQVCVREIHARFGEYDLLYLASGSDVPVKSMEYILTHAELSCDKSYFAFSPWSFPNADDLEDLTGIPARAFRILVQWHALNKQAARAFALYDLARLYPAHCYFVKWYGHGTNECTYPEEYYIYAALIDSGVDADSIEDLCITEFFYRCDNAIHPVLWTSLEGDRTVMKQLESDGQCILCKKDKEAKMLKAEKKAMSEESKSMENNEMKIEEISSSSSSSSSLVNNGSDSDSESGCIHGSRKISLLQALVEAKTDSTTVFFRKVSPQVVFSPSTFEPW